MTTVYRDPYTCGVCHHETRIPTLGSMHELPGPFDLDMRPPEPQRSLLYYGVQRCEHCGFCYGAIEEGKLHHDDTIQTEAYQSQLEHADYPELANKFLCAALIHTADGEPHLAGWMTLRAAWACDDAGNTAAARRCRRSCRDCWLEAIERELTFAADRQSHLAMLADVTRRAGLFKEARELILSAMKEQLTDNVRAVLRKQMALVSNHDSAKHTFNSVWNAAETK